MKVKIYPSKCSGEVTLPPSKSMAHRAIICASLANGKSIIKNIAYSDDILATIEGMKKLGATISKNKDSLEIIGIKDFSNIQDKIIDCNESGSTLRFFIPIFSLTGEKIEFRGKNRLLQRPQHIYEKIFKEQGLFYFQNSDKLEIEGKLKAGKYIVDGNISSQFISGLLFTLPLLTGDSIIKINPPFESKSYIDLTIDMLKTFEVNVEFIDDLTLSIKGNQKYFPTEYTVEGDYSQLGFFAVLGSLNNSIICKGLKIDSKQGDKEIIEIIKKCGLKVKVLENGYKFYSGTPLSCEINLENCPDLGPILTVLTAFGKGKFKIYNAQRLRLKESDRIEAMEMELKKLGVNISSDENNIYISGNNNYSSCDEVFGHKDHRIVMSLAIMATLLDKPLIIDGAEAINKSYPNFFEDLASLNIKIKSKN
ncbi:3-phosphoshikimate 1-carboxyvinyltransferase [uncultured Fusobacterium sp.]|uniref:3-phosphoshikimate 1-carboxyvinyltransferase n=1 Tax=uncultured Fusobacterium sp. TaxID=159267 RepID=UPI0025F6D5CA|nr:3-phosphoshikimate 1-carboxyvinyltransferase [uncultured Fusobacterium sp.]